MAKEQEDEESIAWCQEHKKKQSADEDEDDDEDTDDDGKDPEDDEPLLTCEEIARIRNNKMKKTELVDVCMRMGLSSGGTKPIIIKRVLGKIAELDAERDERRRTWSDEEADLEVITLEDGTEVYIDEENILFSMGEDTQILGTYDPQTNSIMA